MRPFRQRLGILLLIATLSYGCPFNNSSAVKSFRVALASSGPLVNSLVNSGAIPQSKATAIIADFDAGAGCALTLQNEFSAIPSDLTDGEKTSRKLNASVNALRCWRLIINRQNFAVHPRIKQAADIAEGILASLVVFYSEPGEIRASARPSATVTARDEKQLERQLDDQVAALKKSMQP
jgi:hypothetical protein